MQVNAPDLAAVPSPGRPPLAWYQKFGILVFVLFCFEVGVFLLAFPWLQGWDINTIASYSPWVHQLWFSPYFRGALSGLGLVNIYISIAEIGRLRR